MSEKSHSHSSSGGVGVVGLLGVVFVVLKLVGVIDWSWIWVLCPFWIGIAIFVAFVLVALLVVGVAAAADKAARLIRKRARKS